MLEEINHLNNKLEMYPKTIKDLKAEIEKLSEKVPDLTLSALLQPFFEDSEFIDPVLSYHVNSCVLTYSYFIKHNHKILNHVAIKN